MIGDNIRKLRTKKKMTQKELAAKLSISASTIGMYEQNRNNPDIEIIVCLSEIFDISIDELILGTRRIPKLTTEQITLLNLYDELSVVGKSECLGYIKGYIRCNANQSKPENLPQKKLL